MTFFDNSYYSYATFNEHSDVYEYINYPETVLKRPKESLLTKYIFGIQLRINTLNNF